MPRTNPSRSPGLARHRRGVTNADFLQADAQAHPFQAGVFDVAISNLGAMFFADLSPPSPTWPGHCELAAASACWSGGSSGGEERLGDRRPCPLAMGRQLREPPPGAPGPFHARNGVESIALLGVWLNWARRRRVPRS